MRGFLGAACLPCVLAAALLLAGSGAAAAADTPNAQDMALMLVAPKVLQARDVPAKVVSRSGKPVMLVVYASWCLPCRHTMPGLVQLIKLHKLDFVQPLFLSIDSEPEALASYLLHNDYYTSFEPYLIPMGEQRELAPALAPTGSRYSGKIPYVSFYNRQGKMVSDVLGEADQDTLLRAAAKVKQ